MKVILLKDIAKLGRKFDTKEVSSGYALNLLIPKGLAIAATADAMKKTEAQRLAIEGERKVQEDLLVMNIKGLDGVSITVSGKANEKGHLFAGLHKEVLAEEIFKQTQLQVAPSFIQLDQPIKTVGEQVIEVKGGGKSAKFKLIIESK